MPATCGPSSFAVNFTDLGEQMLKILPTRSRLRRPSADASRLQEAVRFQAAPPAAFPSENVPPLAEQDEIAAVKSPNVLQWPGRCPA